MSLLLDLVLFNRNKKKSYKLTSSLKVILYALGGRIGKNKDTWIRQEELARECDMSLSWFREQLAVLIKMNLVQVTKGVNSHGQYNNYSINQALIKPALQPVDNIAAQEITTYGIPDVPPLPTSAIPDVPTSGIPYVPIPEKSSSARILSGLNENVVSLKETKINKQQEETHTNARVRALLNQYPRKEQEAEAIRAYKENGCEEHHDEIMANLIKRNGTNWGGIEKRYIPFLKNFLSRKQWQDEELTHGHDQGQSNVTAGQASAKNFFDMLRNW